MFFTDKPRSVAKSVVESHLMIKTLHKKSDPCIQDDDVFIDEFAQFIKSEYI